MLKGFFLVIFCFLYQIAKPHIIIRGKVVDASNQLPVEAAQIIYSGASVFSDPLGGFLIDTDTMIHQISVHASFYKDKKVDLSQNVPELLIIYLDPSDLHQLAEVIIENKVVNSLNTISKIDLNTRNVNSSQDLLRVVPGLFIAQHAGGGKAEQIFLRGFDIDHGTDLNVSVDGMPVNMLSHAHGQGYADLHFIIPELVQNVDYAKGPYDAGVGNLGTAGFVKFKTIDVLDKSRVSVEAGQFNTMRNVNIVDLMNTSSKGINKSAYVASEVFTSNGPFKVNQDFNRINLASKFTTQTDKSAIMIQGGYFGSSWNGSGQIPTRAVNQGLISRFGSIDSTEGGSTSRKNLIINYQFKPSHASVIENIFYCTRYDFNLYSNFTFFLKDTLNGDQIQQREGRDLLGYNGSYGISKTFNNWGWKQKNGVSFRFDNIGDIGLFHTKQRLFLNNLQLGMIREFNYSAYTDQQFNKGQFTFNLGLRLDRFQWTYQNSLDSLYRPFYAQKSIVSPKFNILFNPIKQIQVYVKSGKGFHTNDVRTIATSKGIGMAPGVWGSDIGITAKLSEKWWLNFAIWYLYSKQEFVYVGDEAIVEPSGQSLRKGVDLSGRLQVWKWLYLDLDMTLARPKMLDVPKDESYLPLAPLYTATGGVFIKMPNGINGNLRMRHLGDRPANEYNSVKALGYTIIDASVFYTKPKFEVGVIFQNLLDAAWNEAQFDTMTRLKSEKNPVSELHFTPGTPFFSKIKLSFFF